MQQFFFLNHSSSISVELSPKQVPYVRQTTTGQYIGMHRTWMFWMRDFGQNSISACQHVKTCAQHKTCMAWSDVCTSIQKRILAGAFSVRWRFSMTRQCKRALENKRLSISLWLGMQLSGANTWRSTWQRQALGDSGRVSKLSGF